MLPLLVQCEQGSIELRWSCIDDFAAQQVERFFSTLSVDEQSHAKAAKAEMERNTRIIARGILREELAKRTGEAPHLVRLGTGANGKPILVWPQADVRFNLAHSNGWILHAFARGFDIGVDLEHINHAFFDPSLLLNPRAEAASSEVSQQQEVADFFMHWVSQEAILKALGCGLSGLTDRRSMAAESMQILALTAPAGFAAAVAAVTTSDAISCVPTKQCRI